MESNHTSVTSVSPILKKRGGRPVCFDREAVLNAAEASFAEKGYEGTRVRKLAQKVGCNVALISYHFGGKQALYEAVLFRFFEKTGAKYRSELAIEWPELPDPDHARFCDLLYRAACTAISNPQMQAILTRELMSGGRYAVNALTRAESGVIGMIREELELMARKGKLGSDLERNFGIISLWGPVVYSCICSPFIKHFFGLNVADPAYTRSLVVHLTQTFFAGWGGKQLPAKKRK